MQVQGSCMKIFFFFCPREIKRSAWFSHYILIEFVTLKFLQCWMILIDNKSIQVGNHLKNANARPLHGNLIFFLCPWKMKRSMWVFYYILINFVSLAFMQCWVFCVDYKLRQVGNHLKNTCASPLHWNFIFYFFLNKFKVHKFSIKFWKTLSLEIEWGYRRAAFL